jgi:hypothetical protein
MVSGEGCNGWSNRATWLVNLWASPETVDDVRAIRESLEEQLAEIPNGLLKDLITVDQINWRELEQACREEETP